MPSIGPRGDSVVVVRCSRFERVVHLTVLDEWNSHTVTFLTPEEARSIAKELLDGAATAEKNVSTVPSVKGHQ